jgi:hypothetical protein
MLLPLPPLLLRCWGSRRRLPVLPHPTSSVPLGPFPSLEHNRDPAVAGIRTRGGFLAGDAPGCVSPLRPSLPPYLCALALYAPRSLSPSPHTHPPTALFRKATVDHRNRFSHSPAPAAQACVLLTDTSLVQADALPSIRAALGRWGGVVEVTGALSDASWTSVLQNHPCLVLPPLTRVRPRPCVFFCPHRMATVAAAAPRADGGGGGMTVCARPVLFVCTCTSLAVFSAPPPRGVFLFVGLRFSRSRCPWGCPPASTRCWRGTCGAVAVLRSCTTATLLR